MGHTFLKVLIIALGMVTYSPNLWAKLINAGVYVGNQNAKPGTVLDLRTSIYSDAAQANVFVTLGVHKVNGGVVASSPVYAKVFSSQNFAAGKKIDYQTSYTVPSSLENGTYLLVMKAGSQAYASEYLLHQNIQTYPITVTGASTVVTPPPPVTAPVDSGSLVISGIYIPNPSVQAGSSIKIHTGIKAVKVSSAVSLKMEIRRVLASGAVDSNVLVSKSYSGLSFSAGEEKVYALDYAIPATAVNAQYILAMSATNSAGTVTYAKYDSVSAVNTITVSSGSVAPAPSPSPSPSPSATPAPTVSPSPVPVSESYLRGINIMDPGIGPHTNPGVLNTNYTTPTLQALQLLKGRGLQVIRLPIMWERMQRSVGAELHPTYLSEIMQVLVDANTAGIKIILDVHNYARYTTNGTETIFGQSNAPTKEQFADLWKKMATVIRANAAAYNAIYAYDLMNEPYDIPTVNGVSGNKIWEQYAQAAVTAIRSIGENKLIHVEGYSFSSPVYFPTNHPNPFITDSANNIMYQAHMYMDNNSGGVYTYSHAEETRLSQQQGYSSAAARGIARLKVFTDWCAAKQVRCFLGEYGWPNSATVGTADANLWNATGEELMKFMDQVKIGATMWATGSWLSPAANILNTYVLPGRSDAAFEPLSQAAVLEKYPGK
jgi:aryl-phospho-beta-D-glucosidase BglC (GH1 family)